MVDDAGLDPDGDGFTNLDEYIAGTDPGDGESLLQVLNLIPQPFSVTFDTVTGRLYGVEYKDDLLDATWQSLTSNVSGTGGAVEVDDSDQTGKRFYRIQVRLQ